MYVVLGASGNTGSIVANALLDLGKEVRVVGRDSKKLAPFVNRGACEPGRGGVYRRRCGWRRAQRGVRRR